jgi:hypothetical protein
VVVAGGPALGSGRLGTASGGSGVARMEAAGGGTISFFSRSRFKFRAVEQAHGRGKGCHGYKILHSPAPRYIPQLTDECIATYIRRSTEEYTSPMFIDSRYIPWFRYHMLHKAAT